MASPYSITLESPFFQSQTMRGLIVTRYLSAAGLTVLLYDHCLTFEQEKQLIWPSRANVVKWALLSNRYGVEVMLIIAAYALSGINSQGLSDNATVSVSECSAPSDTYCHQRSCKVVWLGVGCFTVISIAVSHAIIILKLWKLWDARRAVMILTMVAFVLVETATIISVGFTAREMLRKDSANILPITTLSNMGYFAANAFFSPPPVNSCVVYLTPPTLRVVWSCMVTFDLFAMLMVIFNALSRPRKRDLPLLKILSRDGLWFFFSLSALGWLNLVVSFRAPASESELGIFCVWALSITIITRMMMSLREAELKKQEQSLLPMTVYATSC